MLNVPQDALGVVMEFLAHDAMTVLLGPGLEDRRWHEAFRDHEPLWVLLFRRRWPESTLREPTRRHYRARSYAARRLRPLPTSRLGEINRCSQPELVFECPVFAELLTQTDRTSKWGAPILHCSVCREDVYVVETLSELEECAAAARCVRFPRHLAKPSSVASCYSVSVLSVNQERAVQFLATVAADPQVTMLSPTLSPLVLRIGSTELEFDVEYLGVRKRRRTASAPSLCSLGLIDSTTDERTRWAVVKRSKHISSSAEDDATLRGIVFDQVLTESSTQHRISEQLAMLNSRNTGLVALDYPPEGRAERIDERRRELDERFKRRELHGERKRLSSIPLRRRLVLIVIAVVVLMLIVGAAVWGIHESQRHKADAAPPVPTQTSGPTLPPT